MKQYLNHVYSKVKQALTRKAPQLTAEQIRTEKIAKERAERAVKALNRTCPEVKETSQAVQVYKADGSSVVRETIRAFHPDTLSGLNMKNERLHVGDNNAMPKYIDRTTISRVPKASKDRPMSLRQSPRNDSFARHIPEEKVIEMLPTCIRQDYMTSVRNNTNWNTAQRIVDNNKRLVHELNNNIKSARTNPFSLNAEGEIIRDGAIVPDTNLREYIEAMRKASIR